MAGQGINLRVRNIFASGVALLALCLAGGIGSEETALGDSPASAIEGVTAPVKGALDQTTAPVTAPLPVIPAPTSSPSGSAPSVPAKAPVKVPDVPAPTTGSMDPPETTTGATTPATDAATAVTETTPAPVEDAVGSIPAASGDDQVRPMPAGADMAADSKQSKPSPVAAPAGEVRLGALRLAPIRNWFVHVWPAMALDRASAAGVLDDFGDETSGIVSQVFVAFGGNASGGTTAGLDAPPTQGVATGDLAAQSSSSSSPLGQLFSSDPAFPIAIFWIGVAGALALLWFVVKRELGLSALRRR